MIFSSVIGLFAFIGAAAVWRWAFGGESGSGPTVDLLFDRIRGRRIEIDKAGSEGARAALYPEPERLPCPHCEALLLGAHECPNRPADAFDEAFEESRGRLATIRPIRRAS